MKRLVWGEMSDNAPMEVIHQPTVQIDTSAIGQFKQFMSLAAICSEFVLSIFYWYPFIGTDVVIVKQGKRICGAGGALACAPIVQDKAYFEIKVQSTGTVTKRRLVQLQSALLYMYCCYYL